LPAVATPVGGIPPLLSEDPALGRLVPQRSSDAAAAAIIEALSSESDRARIRALMEHKSWQQTAESVRDVFEQAIDEYQRETKG
jgi:glycosyltransferase involved in cell wall biosynthesis